MMTDAEWEDHLICDKIQSLLRTANFYRSQKLPTLAKEAEKEVKLLQKKRKNT